MKAMNSEVDSCSFTDFEDLFFNLLSGFFDDLFYPGRMNPSICYQLMKGQPGDFSSYRIESGKDNRLRSIVDNNFDTCSCFKSTYIATFSSNDPPLHFVRFNMEYSNGVLNCIFSSNTLNCLNNNSFCLLVGCHFGFVEYFIYIRHSTCLSLLLQ